MDQERRRADDKHWDTIQSYIQEGTEFRVKLEMSVEQIKKDVSNTSVQLTLLNGRLLKAEETIRDLKTSDDGRKGVEKVVGTVAVAGACATVGALMLWVGKAVINTFRNGG